MSLLNAVIALCTMFLLHAGVTWLHHNVRVVHDAVQNRPVLLVADGLVLDDALRRTGTSRTEVFQAVRLHGMASLDEVGALVLERSGEFSVVGRSTQRSPEVFSEVVDTRR